MPKTLHAMTAALAVALLPVLLAQNWERDRTFLPVLESGVPHVAPSVQGLPDGRMIVRVTHGINGLIRADQHVRLTSDGTVDPSFAPLDAIVFSLRAAYPDGRLLAVESRSDPATRTFTARLVRLLPSGLLDSSFTPVDAYIHAAEILPEGRILVRGPFLHLHGVSQPKLALLEPDGTLVAGFRSPFSTDQHVLLDAAMLPNGQILVCNSFALPFAGGRNVARLNPDGSVDPRFLLNAAGLNASRIYVSPDGSVLVAEQSQLSRLVRLLPSGDSDPGFRPQFVDTPWRFGPRQRDGSIFHLTRPAPGSAVTLRRLLPDGTTDPRFRFPWPHPDSENNEFPADVGDGRFVLSAAARDERYTSGFPLFRVLPDGAIDPSFNLRFSGGEGVSSWAWQADGKALAAGPLQRVNGVLSAQPYNLVRFLPDGRTDPGFHALLSATDRITHLRPLPDGALLAFGEIAHGSETVPVMRFNPDGSRDSGFRAPPAAGGMFADGAVDQAGNFYGTPASGQPALVKFLRDGAPDPSFQSASVGPLMLVTPLMDGNILAARAPNTFRADLIRLRPDGSRDEAFQLDPAAGDRPTAGLAALPDGRAVLGTYSSSRNLLRLIRISPGGFIDHVYHAPLPSEPGSLLTVGGALSDLVRGTGGQTCLRIAGGSIVSPTYTFIARDGGKLTVDLKHYVRAAGESQGADPRPRLVGLTTEGPNRRTAGGAIVFGAEFSGLQPMRYELRRNGAAIRDSFVPSFQLNALQPADAGDYTLVATNEYGTATTEPFPLSIDSSAGTLVVIEQHPRDVAAPVGGRAVFTVIASGSPPLAYQWDFDGRELSGATNSTLTLERVSPSDAGRYRVQVRNPAGPLGSRAFSANAVLTVQPPFRGVYFGAWQLADTVGAAAFAVEADGTVALLARLPGSGAALVATDLSVAIDGRFSGTVAQLGPAGAAMPRPLTGRIGPTGVQAAIDGLGAITAQLVEPSDVPSAGYFRALALGGESAVTHAIVAPDRRVLAVTVADGVLASVIDRLGADWSGRFPAAGGLELRLTIDLASAAIHIAGEAGAGATAEPHRLAGVSFTGFPAAIPRFDRLANLSTRGAVGAGSDALIAGFVVHGTRPRPILIRATGPALAAFGVTGTLADPRLTIFRDSTRVAESDNWPSEFMRLQLPTVSAAVGAFPLPRDGLDAACLVTLPPGAYTAQVTGAGDAGGAALIEVYDVVVAPHPPGLPGLANVATRGRVGGAAGAMLAGFVIAGETPKQVLIRAVGPTLRQFGLADVLADPVVMLHSGSTVTAANDDWHTVRSATDVAAAALRVGTFPLEPAGRDAALLLTLPPGNYTAEVRAKEAAAGVALIEVYDVAR